MFPMAPLVDLDEYKDSQYSLIYIRTRLVLVQTLDANCNNSLHYKRSQEESIFHFSIVWFHPG